MRLAEVAKIITSDEKDGSYLVHFEALEGHGCIRAARYFPDPDETPFESERDAWNWAAAFANAMGHEAVINVYVVNADDWTPVNDYRKRICNRR